MRSKAFRVLKCCVVALALSALGVTSTQSHQEPGKVDFRRDVQPLLRQHCVSCHGPSQQMNTFRLDRRRDAMKGGTAPMIAPGNSQASRLYLKLIGSQYGPQMPPTDLCRRRLKNPESWIDQRRISGRGIGRRTGAASDPGCAILRRCALRQALQGLALSIKSLKPRGPAGTP